MADQETLRKLIERREGLVPFALALLASSRLKAPRDFRTFQREALALHRRKNEYADPLDNINPIIPLMRREFGDMAEAMICALLVHIKLADPALSRAELLYPETGHVNFIFWYDLAYGIYDVTSGLTRGIHFAANKDPDEWVVTNIDFFKGFPFLPEMYSPQLYLDLQQTVSIEKQLIERDKTGFQLADYIVDRRGKLTRKSRDKYGRLMHVPEFVQKGQELARKVYKSLYSSFR